MRSRRRTPAGGVQAEKQRRYVQLIAQGLGNSEACRVVGMLDGATFKDGIRVTDEETKTNERVAA